MNTECFRQQRRLSHSLGAPLSSILAGTAVHLSRLSAFCRKLGPMFQKQSCLTSTGKQTILLSFWQCCHNSLGFWGTTLQRARLLLCTGITWRIIFKFTDLKITAYIELDQLPALQSGSAFRFTLIKRFWDFKCSLWRPGSEIRNNCPHILKMGIPLICIPAQIPVFTKHWTLSSSHQIGWEVAGFPAFLKTGPLLRALPKSHRS